MTEEKDETFTVEGKLYDKIFKGKGFDKIKSGVVKDLEEMNEEMKKLIKEVKKSKSLEELFKTLSEERPKFMRK